MIRISHSTLTQFQKLQQGTLTLQQLIDALQYKIEPTPEMQFGRDFHKRIETTKSNDVFKSMDTQSIDNFCAWQLDFEFNHVPLIHELKTTKQIDIQDNNISIVGVADAICGNLIIEFKTTGYYQYDNYANSFQHDLYMWLFDCERTKYYVFEFYNDKTTGLKNLKNIHEFEFVRNDDNLKKVWDLCSEFIDYLKQNNILHLITK